MVSSSNCSSPQVRMASHQHRVLLYATCYNVLDGVTLTIRKLEQEILAAGHFVCILTTRSGDLANTHLDGVHPHRRVVFLDNAVPIPFLNDPNQPELTYQIGFSLSSVVKAELEAFEPSLIHITTPDCTALHLIQYARKKEIPIMGTYHSNIPEYMEHYPGLSWLKHILGAFFRHQYNFLQALYVPTPYIKRHLIDSYKMDRVTNVDVWGRGVDVEKFHPRNRSLKYRRDLGIGDKEVVVCWVGRLVPEKRPDLFAHVVRRLAARHVPFHALVVGAGAYEEEIKSLPNTTFTGWMNADQLAVAYASSDVFLFPSAVETFGNVTLEAAASGLPVVVEAGCSGHLVRDGENGFACPADDEDAFFEATLQLVVNASMRRDFSIASRQLSLSLEKRAVVRQMINHYSQVTDSFYTEYGGHHFNRDSAYRKPDSFLAGNHPRPMLLIVVESLFIVLFQVIWNMTQMFGYMHETFVSILRPAPGWQLVQSSNLDRNVSPRHASTVSQKSTFISIPSSHRNTPSKIGTVVELMPSSSTDTTQSGELSTDASAITDATQEDSVGSSSNCLSCGVSQYAFGDCPAAHKATIAFIELMFFVCRSESQFRNLVQSFCSSSASRGKNMGKRKNSSFALGRLQRRHQSEIALTRVRSDGAEIETPLAQIGTSMEGHCHRRNQVLGGGLDV